MMDSYTAMSDEAVNAAVRASNIQSQTSEFRFPMELNLSDFQMMLLTLQAAYEHTADGGCHEGAASLENQNAAEIAEWASQWCSDMAGTVGIEFV